MKKYLQVLVFKLRSCSHSYLADFQYSDREPQSVGLYGAIHDRRSKKLQPERSVVRQTWLSTKPYTLRSQA